MKFFNSIKSHSDSKRFFIFHTGIMVMIITAIIILGLCFGSEYISLKDVFSSYFENSIHTVIIFSIRLPRVLLAGLCGMLLAGAGAVFQGFFRNPIADSGLIGISSGATLGAVISVFLPAIVFTSVFTNPIVIFAFLGALFSAILVYTLSFKLLSSYSAVMMLLIGSALTAFLSAIVSVLLLLYYQELYQVFVWTLGSFNGRSWEEIKLIALPSLIAFFLLFLCVRSLDVLSPGEESAQALGVDLKKIRLLTLASGSLACACAVSVAGTIGFVGLIAPHIARKLYGEKHRNVLFFGMLWGAVILMISDTLARTIAAPSELPVGIVTAIMGAPFFIVIIYKRKGIVND